MLEETTFRDFLSFAGLDVKPHQEKAVEWMLKREKNASILCIYVTAKLLTSRANVYYPTIQCIGDAIKKELI